jgi:hypothetical protein
MMGAFLSPDALAAIERGKAASLHIEEAGIESRFESMCLARGFTYAVERLEAVKQRVHARLGALGVGDSEEWVG